MIHAFDSSHCRRSILRAAAAMTLVSSLPFTLLFASPDGTAATRPVAFHRITVVDGETGRGVPCIRLTMTDSRVVHTDSAGVVAFAEPDLMGKTVFFTVEGFGYSFAPNGFGQRGRAIDIVPGSSSTLSVRRINVAERLYRITGTGIYRDSMLLGDAVPPTQDETTIPVAGMDSVLATVYRGRMFWFWGDTSMTDNPLGNFRTTGAMSDLPDKGGLDPDRGVSLTFFRKGPKVRPMFDDRHQPIWVGAPRVLLDGEGREHLFTNYSKVTPTMATVERGLAEFDDEAGHLRISLVFPADATVLPEGHAFRCKHNGTDYLYYAHPWPCVRSLATIESLRDLKSLEAFTCIKDGRRACDDADDLDRDDKGNLRWAWRKNTVPVDGGRLNSMIQQKLIRPDEACWSLRDTNTTASVAPHSGSVYYNAHRDRWISIRSEVYGAASFLGEVWYFEGDTPLGPWVYGQKIVTHRMGEDSLDKLTWSSKKAETYSFYNPAQHPEFDKQGGRIVYFEGTYTSGFAGDNVMRTPGYDYNQIMYKLDLEDARVRVPVPVYRVQGSPVCYRTKMQIPADRRDVALAFFAPDRPRTGTVPVYEIRDGRNKAVRLTLTADASTTVVFHAVGPETQLPDGSPTVPLYEFTGPGGDRVYTADPSFARTGYARSEKPLCRVWPNPIRFDPLAVQLAAGGKP